MAKIVHTSLDIIRRHKLKHPRLHARWGDVTITPPVEGAWSHFDNPYLREDDEYGPGFVPGLDTRNKEVILLDYDTNGSEDELSVQDKDILLDEKTEKETDSKAMSKAKRLTRILLPSSVNSPVRKSVEKEKANDFKYRPVQPDYAQEVAEKVDKQKVPHFRYMPASRHYLHELKRDGIRLNDDDKCYPDNGVDDDADDEYEDQKSKPHARRQQRLRSHSCEPDMGRHSVTATMGRRKPRSRREPTLETINSPVSNASFSDALSSSTISRKSSLYINNSPLREQSEQNPNQYAVPPDPRYPTVTVQRSRSAVSRLHRRTMTLEMVRDQDDLWY